MSYALRRHWPEYLMEAAGLGIFMISACVFTILLEHPGSPVRMAINDPFVRRFLIGVAMGLTAIVIIYSPWGKQSGAHINPSVTLTFLRLGKVKSWDAAFYIIAQFTGALLGVILVVALVRHLITHPSVNFVDTLPGSRGTIVAFIAELAISFILMMVILIVSNTNKIARYTGIFAGILVATYITLEAPLSGMSMNPARTFGSAIPAHHLMYLWVYFTAPVLGMLLASEVYIRVMGLSRISCAKLHHQNDKRCIHCGYPGAIKSAELNATIHKAYV
jgi:aquaporin Z